MSTFEAVLAVAGSIAGAAATLAAALKLLAGALVKAIREAKPELAATREALDRNTAALDSNSRALRERNNSRLGAAGLLFVLLCPGLALTGCGSVDPLIIRALERNREVWQEDRRADLDPELVKSREAEFEAQLRYARSK
ncbi:hypothetical protein EDM80_07225 [bacterium]|nr:MAG: hypothetical protein EDM80_07225 [bacterium]